MLAMRFEYLLFQMILLLLLAIGVSWANLNNNKRMEVPGTLCWSAAIIMRGWIFTRLFLTCFLDQVHSQAQIFTLVYIYMISVLLPQWRWLCNTSMAPPENSITCSHKKLCHNKWGSEGCEQGAKDGVFKQWLTSRRLQYPNLLLPSSPVNMKEKVSL